MTLDTYKDEIRRLQHENIRLKAALNALISTDDTITEKDAGEALRILSGRKLEGSVSDIPVSRNEAAKMLKVSVVTVTSWAKAGIIKRLTVKGRRKAFGYSLNSINALLSGNTKDPTDGK